jgi:predicted nucleic acid-binding protein
MEGKIKVTGCVLDTSVVIKWFSSLEEADLDNALCLRDAIVERDCAVTVPDLLFYELANALRHNPNFSCDDVKDAVAAIRDMGFTVIGVDAAHLSRALEIAFEFKTTVYDAYFMALAEAVGSPFVTADYRFHEKVKKAGNVVRLDKISDK